MLPALSLIGVNGLIEATSHELQSNPLLTPLWTEYVEHLVGNFAMESVLRSHKNTVRHVLEVTAPTVRRPARDCAASPFHAAITRWVVAQNVSGVQLFWNRVLQELELKDICLSNQRSWTFQFDCFHGVGHGLFFNQLRAAAASSSAFHHNSYSCHVLPFASPYALAFSESAASKGLQNSLTICLEAPLARLAGWCASGVYHSFFEFAFPKLISTNFWFWPCDRMPFQDVCFRYLFDFPHHESHQIRAAHWRNTTPCVDNSFTEATTLACISASSVRQFEMYAEKSCSVPGLELSFDKFCHSMIAHLDVKRYEACVLGCLDYVSRLHVRYVVPDSFLDSMCLSLPRGSRVFSMCMDKIGATYAHPMEWAANAPGAS